MLVVLFCVFLGLDLTLGYLIFVIVSANKKNNKKIDKE